MDWLTTFKNRGAIWLHNGNAERPHAELTSGKHSNGFVNCTYVTQHPNLIKDILTSNDGLATHLPEGGVDWVIGSAMGAVTFAYAVAEVLNCQAGFTEKDEEAMKLKRFTVLPGQKVLVVEDTISTGGSTVKSINGIRAATNNEVLFVPFILCLVDRSGKGQLEGLEIRSLIQPKIEIFEPNDCPLCKMGSKVVRPKTNWAELTA